jgi:heptaprenyl diphosphate synthase
LSTEEERAAGRPTQQNLTALFGALCLFFATIEYLFPKPLPFLRLGLANLPLLLALGVVPTRNVLLVALLKVVGQGLLHGTFASYVFLFSLSGTAASVLVMIGAARLGGRQISLVGVSLLGALASNAVQILLSINFIFGQNARMIAPVLLGFGSIGGLLVGLLASEFSRRSRWYARVRASQRSA